MDPKYAGPRDRYGRDSKFRSGFGTDQDQPIK
jgi:hypothetical protein